MPVEQRLGWGRTQCDPLLLGEALPINTYGGLFHNPRPKYIRRGTLPTLSHNPTQPQEPKTKLWATDPKGAHVGGCFLHPPFWAHGQVTPNPKKWGSAILGTPILGPSVSLSLFCSFGLLSISGPPGRPSRTDTQPIARKPNYLGANLN